MPRFFTLAPVALALMAPLSQAYWIDASCGSSTAVLKEKIDCAFDMAKQAMAYFNNPPTGTSAEVTWLLNELFATQTPLSGEEWVKVRFDGEYPSNFVGNTPRAAGVLAMQDPVASAANIGKNDVIVYCDTKRFEYQSGKKRWYNTVLKEYVSETSEPDANPNNDCALGTAMWTYVSQDPNLNSEIQVCGWFLDFVTKQPWPSCTSFGAKLQSLVARYKANDQITKMGWTEFDLFTPLEKVFLHELTHTRSGGQTNDVKMNLNGDDDVSNLAYGWTKAKQITTRNNPVNGPTINADTFALFGSGVRIINGFGHIHDDGTLTWDASSSSSKRSENMTAVEFEA